ncbi:MAG: DNA polymerase I [Bdellovibrio sp.]|nr:DNA polymerase I [Bdellovibrio sp.]
MSQKNEILPPSKNTLYLVDISSFIFRAFFAIRSLKNKAGEPTNAVYGVATMLARLADEAKPEYLAVVYDSKEPSFRKEVYPEYKANRSAPPDDLVPQFDRIEELIAAFEIHSYRMKGVEADDLIATLAHRWCAEAPHHHVVIVSSDKDLMQLVSDRVEIWDTMSNKFYAPPQVEEKFGVKPEQIRDYLALVGDSSDNIPGVAGIGPKGASDLLKQFGTLDRVLDAARKNEIAGKKGESLRTCEKDALLSAELATVKVDLPVHIPMESLKYRFHVNDTCLNLLKTLDFHSLVAKWGSQAAVNPTSSAGTIAVASDAQSKKKPQAHFKTVRTLAELSNIIKGIQQSKFFGIDLETTALNPRAAKIVGVAVCYDPAEAFYIPVGHSGDEAQLKLTEVLEALKPLLEDVNIKKIGQNLKFDLSIFSENGVNVQGLGADTMIAAFLLDPDGRHNLKTLAEKYLDYSVLTYEEVCGKGKDQITFDQLDIETATRYSAEDAWIAIRLWEKLEPRLVAEELEQVFYKADLPLVEVLARMELEGVCLDVPWLRKLSEEFALELNKIETRIQAFTQGPVNLNSPKQLAQLLFEELKLPTQAKTKTGFSTDASVLEALAPLHEVPRLLLEYRELSKLKGTYVDPLPELCDPKSGKIHTSFHQTIAATGRLSCSDPNLQNIPIRSERGLKIRRGFIPSPGNLLLSADYSQIELRLLAHMSGDPELVGAFQRNEDVHRKTASDLFGVSVEGVSEQQRGIAKAINFGLMYGKTAFGLSQEMKIPRREAQEIIDRYFTKYRAVKFFLDSQILSAREKGYVVSLLGRKRWLPDIRSKNPALRNNAERMAMNSPLQGTAADLMKMGMIEIDRRLKAEKLRSKLLIQVHDEVVLDCPEQEVDVTRKLVCHSMENAFAGVIELSVPLVVNSAIGKNWMDL